MRHSGAVGEGARGKVAGLSVRSSIGQNGLTNASALTARQVISVLPLKIIKLKEKYCFSGSAQEISLSFLKGNLQ